jgi:NitT/TauT family transport system substrate-binding protein
MTRAIFATQKWLHAAAPAAIANAIASFFPSVPAAHLTAACARYRALGVWGRDPILPQAGFDRLRAGLLSGGLVRRAPTFEQAVDNRLARSVIEQNPPALARPA